MKGFSKLITAPVNSPISFEQAADHLRLDEIERDTIESLIEVAREHIEGKNGWLGRVLITQTWELTLDSFPCNGIELPLAPVQEVESVTYLDQNGVRQTLSGANYTVTDTEPARIIPVYGASFPTARCYPGSIKVTYVAGYGDDSDFIPSPIKQAMLLLIGHFYENREIVVTGATVAQIPYAVDALLNPYRLSWL